MTTDFYPVLFRAIRSLDPDTPADRIAVYNRARQMLASHLHSRNATQSEARAEQSALERAIERIETETAKANKLSSAVEAGAPTRTGAFWTLIESFRVIGSQPAILLVVGQAAIVEWVDSIASSSLGLYAGSSLGFYFATLWGLFVFLYIYAGIWGGLIDAADRALQPLRFWIYGFKYLVRSLGAFVWSIIMFLPAFGITTAIILISIVYTVSSSGAPLPRGSQVIPTLIKLTVIVWVVNLLWASRRLLVQLPAIFASGDMGVADRIIRERGREVTVWWLIFIILNCIFVVAGIAASMSLGLLSAISGMIGAFWSLLGSLGGAVPTTPFRIPQGGFLGGAAPTTPFGIPGGPGVAPLGNSFTVLSLSLQLAFLALWNLFQTFLCLASLVYYRSAGGNAAWFSLGAMTPISRAKPTPSAPPARTKETHTAPTVHATATPTEKAGQTAARSEVRAPGFAVDWAWLRLPDFRPLLTGKLVSHMQLFLAAPECSVSAWPPDISPRAATAIPVTAFTLLGLAAMIGRGGGLIACLVSGICGFAFGIVALRASAAFERRIIVRKAATDIGREASELDLSVASLALILGAALTLLVTALWRVSFVWLPLIATVMLSGVSIGMMFSPAATLFIARRLDVSPAVWAAATITASIVFTWMLFTYFVWLLL